MQIDFSLKTKMRTKEQRNMSKLNAQNMHLSESLRSLEKKVKSRKLMCIKVCTWKIALCIGLSIFL